MPSAGRQILTRPIRDGITYKDTSFLSDPGREDSADEQIYPRSPALHQNYPNPFTSSTDIRFDLPEVQPVRLVVYHVLGRAVLVLVKEVRAASRHEVVFEAGALLPSGLYLYRLETPQGSLVQRMQLVK